MKARVQNVIKPQFPEREKSNKSRKSSQVPKRQIEGEVILNIANI